MRKVLWCVLAIAAALPLATCGSGPTAPADPPIATLGSDNRTLEPGRWSGGGGTCLSVESAECQLFAGCWRGRFAKPTVNADGTFSVDGTFRFEAGPEKDENPPPARFTGAISGSTLTLTVQPASGQPVAYELTFAGSGSCPRLCL